MMEGIFKFWRIADNKSFDVQHLWLVDLFTTQKQP